MVDRLPTVIQRIHGNYAKGYVINSQFQKFPCFIAKRERFFAHGDTLREAYEALQDKMIQAMSREDIIAEFCKNFDAVSSYSGSVFFEWHHRLTGSCLMGREKFVEDNNISLEKLYTVKQFIDLTENDYGGDIIKELKQHYIEV